MSEKLCDATPTPDPIEYEFTSMILPESGVERVRGRMREEINSMPGRERMQFLWACLNCLNRIEEARI